MLLDFDLPADPREAGAWDADDDVLEAREAAAQQAPETWDLLAEVSGMITMQAAERLVRIDEARREALVEAARHGRGLASVVERSVRLEIAALLRVTEHAAATMMAQAEVDHTVAWEHGGETSLDNLAPLCKGHHTVKHHGGWRIRQVPDGLGAEWTSPAGRRYIVEPEHRVPVFRSDPSIGAPPF